MINNEHVLAIIPARGGSIRIKRKNLLPLNGKPLIYYTISEALKSNLIDNVIVYTDDEEIKEEAISFGAEVPLIEPKEYSDGSYTIIPFKVREVINFLEAKYDSKYILSDNDVVVVLQPTCPLRDYRDINNAINIFASKKHDIVASVINVDIHPYRMRLLDGDGGLKSMFSHSEEWGLSQNFPEAVKITGGIYIASRNTFMTKDFYDLKWGYSLLEDSHGIDIDTLEDLSVVSSMLMALENQIDENTP